MSRYLIGKLVPIYLTFYIIKICSQIRKCGVIECDKMILTGLERTVSYRLVWMLPLFLTTGVFVSGQTGKALSLD